VTFKAGRLWVKWAGSFVLLALAFSAGAGSALAAEGESGAPYAYGVAAPRRVHHVRLESVCAAPTPGHPQCGAARAVQVPSGTANSVTYTSGGYEEAPEGGLTPNDLAKAYQFSPTASGSGQTIALYAADNDPALEESLATFDNQYKIAACTEANGCFKRVNSNKAESPESLPKMSKNQSVETSLDVEAARAMCQRCNIIVVETSHGGPEDVERSVELGATVVSSSYSAGQSSSAVEEYDTVGKGYNHPGVVILNDAGDYGYDTWDILDSENSKTGEPNTPGENVQAPGIYPYVISVGANNLELNEAGERTNESVWDYLGALNVNGRKKKETTNASLNDATDGGCSEYVLAPSWQLTAPGWAATGCGDKRLANDISALGGNPGFGVDDSYVCPVEKECHGKAPGWINLVGTSLATPLVAGMFGLAGGAQGVSYPGAILYSHLGEAGAFYDVAQGGNGYCGGDPLEFCGHPNKETLIGWNEQVVPGGAHHVDCEYNSACNAVTGFDGPTGVGSPQGLYGFKADDFTAVTQTTATIQWRVNPDGSNVTECKFEIGTTTSYGVSGPCKKLPGSGDVPVQVSTSASGLQPNTTYHYRVVSKSSNGTFEGPDIFFTTLSIVAPSVETKGTSGVGASSATLYASVDPRGGSVSTCKFEYGTSTSYGSSVSCAALPGGGSSPVAVDAAIGSGLAANTEYHYRISATNSSGTSKGADATFKTS
jgi:hypothetical protein